MRVIRITDESRVPIACSILLIMSAAFAYGDLEFIIDDNYNRRTAAAVEMET